MTEGSRKGRFITFEGADGSGKTTQIPLLADRLRSLGRDVVQTVEPGGTSIGLQVRRILLDTANQELCPTAEMLLYFAARAQNFDQIILPAWEAGAVVLSDRYTDSTLAYQGGGRGLSRNVVLTLHDIACHGLQPDLTIYIDIDVATGLERAAERAKQGPGRDRLENEAAEFHERVRAAYLELAREHSNRIKVVDGRGDRAQVAERIWSTVQQVL